jgi:hypothetical protein
MRYEVVAPALFYLKGLELQWLYMSQCCGIFCTVAWRYSDSSNVTLQLHRRVGVESS